MTRALLIVDHGSRRAEANATLAEVARMIEALAPGVVVRHAHMELAEPTIAQGLADCAAAGAREVIVVPYMLAPGRHASEDIPRLVADAAAAHPGLAHRVTEPLGVDAAIGDLVLRRAGLRPR